VQDMTKRKWTQTEISSYKKKNGQHFYYNKEDSNIIILKESRLGFSLDWANPWSWIIVIYIIIFVVLSIFFKEGYFTPPV